MRDEGKLPGLSSEDHGHLESLPMQRESSALDYPQTVTMKVEKDPSVKLALFYTLRKTTAQSQWALVKAWQENTVTGEKRDLLTGR
jgi:hypothetical protein